VKVYQSLTRPKLKQGAEWKLAALNGLITLALTMSALFYWRRLWLAVAVYVPLRLFFRWAAQHDPQWTSVYAGAWGHNKVFLAHKDPYAETPAIERFRRWWRHKRGNDRVLPKPPKWVV
jgi:type IV secretory pathway TrbD component